MKDNRIKHLIRSIAGGFIFVGVFGFAKQRKHGQRLVGNHLWSVRAPTMGKGVIMPTFTKEVSVTRVYEYNVPTESSLKALEFLHDMAKSKRASDPVVQQYFALINHIIHVEEVSVYTVARALGVDKSTIRNRMKRAGVYKARKDIKDIKVVKS